MSNSLGFSLLGGKRSHELILLFEGLEFTVTDLGGGIDELDVHSLGGGGLSLLEEGLSNGDKSLSWSHNGTLDEHEIFVDNTVVRESTDWGNVLGMGVGLGGGVVLGASNGSGTDSVDLLVDLGSVVVTEVTSSGDSPLDCGWMPGTDTSDLSVTSSSLSWELGNTESLDASLSSLTSGNGDGINHLVVLEDFSDGDFVFELANSEVDLGGDITTVNSNIQDKVIWVTSQREEPSTPRVKLDHSPRMIRPSQCTSLPSWDTRPV